VIKAKFNPQVLVVRYFPGLRKLTYSEIGIPRISRVQIPKRNLILRGDPWDAAMSRLIGNYTKYSDRYTPEVNVNLEQKQLYEVFLKTGYLQKEGRGDTGYNIQSIKLEPIEQVIRAVAEENNFSNLLFVPIFLMILLVSRFIVVESIKLLYKKVK